MKILVSSSVISFKERAIKTWGIDEWQGLEDPDQDVLFFGLYTDNDFEVFRRHSGKKTVFWCGSDILFLIRSYDRKRILKNFPETEHYCENQVEAKNLELCGVKVNAVVPSFLDDFEKFPISFKPSEKPHIFMCGHPSRENEYGFDLVREVAQRVPEATFHMYGISGSKNYFYDKRSPVIESIAIVDEDIPNIYYHGKVSEQDFNSQISQYHCGLRTNEHDGFSEVIAKSILMGQYPISKIPYERIWSYRTEDELVSLVKRLATMKEPNHETRSYYLKMLNKYPWVK